MERQPILHYTPGKTKQTSYELILCECTNVWESTNIVRMHANVPFKEKFGETFRRRLIYLYESTNVRETLPRQELVWRNVEKMKQISH